MADPLGLVFGFVQYMALVGFVVVCASVLIQLVAWLGCVLVAGLGRLLSRVQRCRRG